MHGASYRENGEKETYPATHISPETNTRHPIGDYISIYIPISFIFPLSFSLRTALNYFQQPHLFSFLVAVATFKPDSHTHFHDPKFQHNYFALLFFITDLAFMDAAFEVGSLTG